jgi:Mor family transcriptional regulator
MAGGAVMRNAERNAEIIRRRQAGELPHQITRAMGVSRNVVAGVLDRAGLGNLDPDAKSKAMQLRSPKGEAHGRSRLTEADVREIRREYQRGRGPELAKRYGLSNNHLCAIARGLGWNHVA